MPWIMHHAFLQAVQRNKIEVRILPCSQSKEPEYISSCSGSLHLSAFSTARLTLVCLLSLHSHVVLFLLSAPLKDARACAGHLYLHLWPCVRLGTHWLAVPCVSIFELLFPQLLCSAGILKPSLAYTR